MGTLKNLNSKHLSTEQVDNANTAIDTLKENLGEILSNLTSDERRRYGSVSEQNKLFVNKVYDFRKNQPDLSSPDVDWEEFINDFNSRNTLEALIARLQKLFTGITNAKTLCDHDNYQAALDDYAYTNYKAGTSDPHFEAKQKELKQFFSRSKKANAEKTDEQK
ncbi:MAG: hypothetical protein N4A46_14655 [Schleiferiaceae bacterium]|jgi:hypothetical protein|nr:hypothetical protein [Schleiferiaceae bacterium]